MQAGMESLIDLLYILNSSFYNSLYSTFFYKKKC